MYISIPVPLGFFQTAYELMREGVFFKKSTFIENV